MNHHTFQKFILALSLPFIAGCSEYSPYKVVMVKGDVLVDGQPVEGITVTFSPVNSAAGHGAGGVTDAKGHFRLTTGGLKVGKGAEVGEYNVSFAKGESRYDASGSTYYVPILPMKYASPSTSGIEPVKIVENTKDNVFQFKLSMEGAAQEAAKIEKMQEKSQRTAPKIDQSNPLVE
ncbi:MAG: carboxypeptidase-like regulatory domain-containing protein [Planctomycetaceae bacterium]|jgi:hypothetical protein|nr:carboxypeptidase-like regulatory domain-containing protein [Planctomycetaceae bacterium]